MKPKVFFNDECSLCNMEINHYKKKITHIEFNGIHSITNLGVQINKSPKQLIRRLHVKKDNKILIGVDAFIYIWSQMPGFVILSRIIKIPIIYQFSKLIYEILAFLLYLKNFKHVNKIIKIQKKPLDNDMLQLNKEEL